jgi:hypothetical protein
LCKTIANALHLDCIILADKYHRKNEQITSFNLPVKTPAKNQPFLALRELPNDTRLDYDGYFILKSCGINAYFVRWLEKSNKPSPTVVKPKILVLDNNSIKTHNSKYSRGIMMDGMDWGEMIEGKEKRGPHFPISFHHIGRFPNFTQQRP